MKNICIVCGKTLPYKFNHGKQQQYCNQTCFHNRFEIDRDNLLKLLNEHDNVTLAADLLGIYKATLYKYLKRHKIQRKVQWA